LTDRGLAKTSLCLSRSTYKFPADNPTIQCIHDLRVYLYKIWSTSFCFQILGFELGWTGLAATSIEDTEIGVKENGTKSLKHRSPHTLRDIGFGARVCKRLTEAHDSGPLTWESAVGRVTISRQKLQSRQGDSKMTTKTILVVDDDKSILRTFTRILQKNGYEIDAVETGKEAIEKADTRHYDLALVDMRLPDMDGTDLLAKMKKPLQGTIKILITGFPSVESGVKALDEGADAYLVKPVKPEELLMLLEEKLKNKE
jgi:CheY-like chemotaxis protein